ncbi:flagellar hook-basal body complex protein FliE [Brevundimonas sp.]|uniref:flagellar hook-basal body complex protein FliE n=1 Tax=Brevundimonas sp. TaxID=1871086 RepID=UPI002D2935C9|nr:flagellar hook-basal body complex protein FliE [Brevundimonas sp.]HYC68873.1 flagellar hook-basal body complex protein FliE [Brevundimonas sp.]
MDPVALGVLPSLSPDGASAAPATGLSFTRLMSEGVEQTNAKLLEADRLTRAFALGEDIPVHQVTFALEQARLSFELMNQVRTRLIESYQEILRMQV